MSEPTGVGVKILPDNPALDALIPDVTKSESHTFTSTLTKNPVEDGSTVTDQVIVEPAKFDCVVAVTNTPIETTAEHEGVLGTITLTLPPYPPSIVPMAALSAALNPAGLLPVSVQVFQIANPVDRVKRFLDKLNALRLGVETLTIITSKHVYTSMVLTTISMPIEKVNHAEFTLTFEELRIVSSDTVTAPKPKEPRGMPSTDAGAANPVNDAISQGEKMFNNFFSGKTSVLRTAAIAAGG